ncbi:MAG: aerotolerance regulator BatA, partial [Bacteroidales bacterium]
TDNRTLSEVYHEIDQLEKSKINVKQLVRKDDKYLVPAIIAFLLIAIELLLRNTLLRSLT